MTIEGRHPYGRMPLSSSAARARRRGDACVDLVGKMPAGSDADHFFFDVVSIRRPHI
jgi:hypothetical protein